MKRILVTGAEGQLGRELMRQLGDRGIPVDRDELDLTALGQDLTPLLELRPDAIINTAAYTAVDRAETEVEACRAINATAVEHLARACAELDCPLLQVSTDYVFGGERTGRAREEDPVNAESVYAQTKLEGEHHARTWTRHFIVRTCGLYGLSPRNNNFVDTMLRVGAERRAVRVVGDQHCTPSYVRDVARAILFLLSTDAYGTYHVVNEGQTTWYEFACEIFRLANLDVAVERIRTDEYPLPARRPSNSVLDTTKYQSLGGPPLPSWRDALADYLAARAR